MMTTWYVGAGKCTNREIEGNEMSKDVFMHTPGRRLPLMTSPDAYDGLTYLNDEEKRLGKELFYFQVKEDTVVSHPIERSAENLAAQARNPYMLFQWDPELFKAELEAYERMCKLVIGMTIRQNMEQGDINAPPIVDSELRRRFETGMLMSLKAAYDCRSEWAMHVLATLPVFKRILTDHQRSMLGLPDSTLWSDEHRLILRFTEAVMNRTVTDELFARAEQFWGRKQMLRYAYWITYYAGIAITFPTLIISDATERVEAAR